MALQIVMMAGALSVTWAAGVQAQAASPADDFVSPLLGYYQAGVFCAPETVGVRDAPDTISGQTNVVEDTPPFASTGRVVPAVLGIGFGVEAGFVGEMGSDQVVMTVTHPRFDGFDLTEQSFVTYVGSEADPSITFYQFDHSYELALGTWTLRATQGAVTLYEATFTVVPPDAIPALADICGFQDLLS